MLLGFASQGFPHEILIRMVTIIRLVPSTQRNDETWQIRCWIRQLFPFNTSLSHEKMNRWLMMAGSQGDDYPGVSLKATCCFWFQIQPQ